jgi:Na+/H+ antiporter NhaD/arsenite permease-like protein
MTGELNRRRWSGITLFVMSIVALVLVGGGVTAHRAFGFPTLLLERDTGSDQLPVSDVSDDEPLRSVVDHGAAEVLHASDPHPGAHLPGEAAEHDGEGHGAGEGHGGPGLGRLLPLWSVIPFAGILLSIAFFPLLAPKFWHHHFPKISAGWAVLFAVPFLLAFGGDALYEILHIYFIDYIPFIILLWALYTVSGGLRIKGTLRGTPAVNCLLLLIGTAIASWVGTTGAAMLMIRPLLRANQARRNKVHTVVFFIFLVANVGGSLTPLGDPPLFLGFLHGVPFFWTLKLLPEMLFVVVALLAIYFALDSHHYRNEVRGGGGIPDDGKGEPIGFEGLHNLLFLGGILGGVILSGFWRPGSYTVLGVHLDIQNTFRDALLVVMGLLSLWTTKRAVRKANEFTWFPITEVAYLFAGIFMTIIPALAILKAGSEGALAPMLRMIREPVHYFWVVGTLSSFLDNAPTYLTFLNSALGQFHAGMPELQAVGALIRDQEIYLKAIATGAVFMGANTYIGNAPNFMVKSIAEESGVTMPSFFGYMLRYSLVILVPVFVLVSLVFF